MNELASILILRSLDRPMTLGRLPFKLFCCKHLQQGKHSASDPSLFVQHQTVPPPVSKQPKVRQMGLLNKECYIPLLGLRVEASFVRVTAMKEVTRRAFVQATLVC